MSKKNKVIVTVNHLTPKAPKTDRKINNKLTFI